MYTIGNVMNVRGHDVQCTLLDKNGNHVRNFYYDKEEQVIWCHNYPELAKEYGQDLHIRISVHAKTKKQAEELMRTEAMLGRMVDVVRGMVAQLAQLKIKRQEAREAKKVKEVEPKPVYKHEIFTPNGADFVALRNSAYCTDAVSWNIAEGEEYYRVTWVNTLDNETLIVSLVGLGLYYDEVITDVLETKGKKVVDKLNQNH